MSQILVSPAAMNFLPTLAWHVVVLAYFVGMRAKSRPTWFFTGWMLGLTIITGSSFVARVIYAPLSGYVYWIGGIGSALLAVTFELQFAYHFLCAPWPREARAVLLVSATVTVGTVAGMLAEAALIPHQAIYNFAQFLYGMYRLDSQNVFTSAAFFDVVHPIGHLWAVIVLLRKTLYLTAPQAGQPWWRRLWQPQTKEARSARTLTCLVAAAPLTAVVEVLEAHYLLPPASFALLYMLFVFAIVLVSIENSSERSAFMVKIMGISLITVLLVIGLVSPRLLAQERETYTWTQRAELAHVETLIETGPVLAGRVPDGVAYVAARPASGGIFASDYRLLFSREPALDAQALAQQDAALKAGLEQGLFNARISMLDQNPWLEPAQLPMEPAGPFDRLLPPEGVASYRQLGGELQGHWIRYLFASPGGQTLYEVGYSYPAHRQTLHRQAMPLLYLVLGTTVLILLVFPRVFRVSLVQPLANLLQGVKRIDAGDLDVSVPVRSADEIGLVTDAFNRMTRSLQSEITERKRAEAEVQSLNLSLEQQIADRTHELAILYEMSAVASQAQSLDTLLADLLSRLVTSVQAEAGAVYLLEDGSAPPEGDLLAQLHSTIHYGLSTPACTPAQDWPAEGELLAWVLAHGEPVLVADVAADPRLREEWHQSGLSTLLFVPLRASGRQLGILCLARRPGRAFGLEEVALLTSVADQVGLSIESARLRHQATLLEERQRLSRELHDSVLQSLYGLSMQADVGAAQPEAATAQTFARIRDVTRQVIKEIRLFVYQLQPPGLEDGLVAALHRRLAAVEGRAGLATRLAVEKHVPLPLPLLARHALYQVAQEALNNVLRHANAANVTLHLDYQAGQHVLEIVDDGCGFDPLAPGEGGIGLGNMRQRMELIGGQLDITSAPDQGTRIAARVHLGEDG